MSTNPERRRLYAAIHAAAAKAGLDDDAYRDLLRARTGKTSAKDLSDRQIRSLLAHLNGGLPMSDNPLARKVHALWRECATAGAVQDGSRKALRAFCGRMTYSASAVSVDPDMLDDGDLTTIIEALKAMAKRHGGEINP